MGRGIMPFCVLCISSRKRTRPPGADVIFRDTQPRQVCPVPKNAYRLSVGNAPAKAAWAAGIFQKYTWQRCPGCPKSGSKYCRKACAGCGGKAARAAGYADMDFDCGAAGGTAQNCAHGEENTPRQSRPGCGNISKIRSTSPRISRTISELRKRYYSAPKNMRGNPRKDVKT